MLLCAGVVVVVLGVLWVTVPPLVVGGVCGGVDIAVGVGGVGAVDGEGVTVVAGVSRGGLMASVLLVLVLGAACVLVFGGSGRATRGWCLAGLWSWLCRLSLVLGYFLRLSLGLWWQVLVRLWSRVSMLRVGGGVPVLPLLVVPVSVLVGAPLGEL